jgi:small subunit ribosomal protein S20
VKFVAKSKTPAKRARNAEKSRIRNKSYKSSLKTSIKNYEASLIENNVEIAKEKLLQVTSINDKSVSKGIIHKNNAAHKKSRLTKKFNSLAQ